MQPRDIGPATAALKGLKKAKELLAIFRKAVAKRSLLNVAVKGFKLSEEEEKCLRLIALVVGKRPKLLKHWLKLSLDHGLIG